MLWSWSLLLSLLVFRPMTLAWMAQSYQTRKGRPQFSGNRFSTDVRKPGVIDDTVPMTILGSGEKEDVASETTIATVMSPRSATIAPSRTTMPSMSPSPRQPPPARAVDVSSDISLPFPVELAYDSFSDLTRQPEWSPWLHSVEYVEPVGSRKDDEIDFPSSDPNNDTSTSFMAPTTQTKWTLKVMGVSYSWISVATKQNRPYLIEWESVSGLKNFGRVQFTPQEEVGTIKDSITKQSMTSHRQIETATNTAKPSGGCHMEMTMTFVPPRLVAAVFRNPNGVKRFMERKLIGSSLQLFRNVVIETILTNAANHGTDNTNATMIFFPI